MYKLIIVDDELGARNILEKYVNKYAEDFEIAGIFEDGEFAIEYLKSNDVDVILTDIRMTKVSGLDLAKYVYENKPEIKVVIISGFGDFEYAKTAIQYRVTDYLLKVIDVDEFVKVMDKIKLKLDQERTVKDDDEISFTREMFFYDLICNTFSSYDEMVSTYESLNFNIHVSDAVFDIYKVEFKNLESFLSDKWHYDKDILKKTLTNIINIIDNKWFVMLLFAEDESILFIMHDSADNKIDDAQIRYEIFDILGLLMDVKEKYQKTIKALYQEDNSNLYDPNEKVMLTTAHNIMNNTPYSKDVFVSQNNSKKEIVDKAIALINEKYNENISRNDIANCVFMNPAYFGTVFKDVTGKSFSDYLLAIRMEKAIEYLEKGNKLDTICKMVGYSDIRNFRRMFKQYTGFTFGEYKENILRNKGKFHA